MGATSSGLLHGIQSALNARGVDAAVIAEITWVLFAGASLVFVAVMALAAYAVFGRRSGTARLSARALIVGGGIVFPVVVLSALLVYTLARAAALGAPGEVPGLRIEVVGEQWWWRVQYHDADGRRDFAAANEIRIPAGTPVLLELRAADVVHSFWVPNLAGKLDMIPGRTNRLTLRAEQPGEFRGQCAEYCGGPHALMALYVIALAPEAYERWAQAQRAPAAPPAGGEHARGVKLFASRCAACHTVRGTSAAGVRGPDLTHVASRVSIGAGLLPTNVGTIADWIAASQRHKPGNLMPSFEDLSGEELHAVARYVASLR